MLLGKKINHHVIRSDGFCELNRRICQFLQSQFWSYGIASHRTYGKFKYILQINELLIAYERQNFYCWLILVFKCLRQVTYRNKEFVLLGYNRFLRVWNIFNRV